MVLCARLAFLGWSCRADRATCQLKTRAPTNTHAELTRFCQVLCLHLRYATPDPTRSVQKRLTGRSCRQLSPNPV
eukprot:6094506-Amphidinium_carterae.1